MNFDFATANRIIFGAGRLKEAGHLAAGFGERALVITGLECRLCEPLQSHLGAAGVQNELFQVSGEPTLDLIQAGISAAREFHPDLIIGFGGGSALDAAKAIAALLPNPGEMLDYLEVVGKGLALQEKPLPCIAIPTTAGTGSEVTRNAVIGVPEHQVKVSLRSPDMLPRLALVDPELSYTLPPQVTATTGLDALTQLIEPFVSIAANPLTDAFCQEGLPRARSLRQAYHAGDDEDARRDMSLASLFGGLALANAKLGAVHGFAGPLGGMFPAPHGAVCARLLPFVMETNLTALRQRQPASPALTRYREVAQILTGDRQAQAEDGIAWVSELCRDLNIPGLSAWGLQSQDFPDLVEKSQAASSMKGNPIVLSEAELTGILEKAS